jgi:hypothetical protein
MYLFLTEIIFISKAVDRICFWGSSHPSSSSPLLPSLPFPYLFPSPAFYYGGRGVINPGKNLKLEKHVGEF